MNFVGLDTATPATAAAVLRADGSAFAERHDPAPGARPGHASESLKLIERALTAAGLGWDDVGRLAVGVGPGGFTGLRIGIATARALAQARGLPLTGVSSLQALAAGAEAELAVAVIDARRGEAFAGAWSEGREVLAPAALAPDALGRAVSGLAAGAPVAVGDGAIRFRAQLEAAGATVPHDGSPLHRMSAERVCRLAAAARERPAEPVLPHYVRAPDAQRKAP